MSGVRLRGGVFWRSILLAGLFAAPVRTGAQPAPSPEQCRAFLAHVPLLELDGPATEVVGFAGDTCRYHGVLATVGVPVGFHAETLTVRGIGFDPAAASGPPQTLRAEAHGVVVALHTGNGNVDYRLAQQAGAPFDATLDVSYDPSRKAVVVRELSLEGERIGRVSIDGEFEGVEPVGSVDAIPLGFDGIGVRRLHARLDSRLFEALYLLAPVVGTFAPSKSVAEAEAQMRQKLALASGVVQGVLRAARASASTIDAVTGAVGDFPHPKHPFEVFVVVNPPLHLPETEAAAGGLDALAKRLDVEATYAGVVR